MTDNTTPSRVYMRVHRDTGCYYIGSTQSSVFERHCQDVSLARQGRKISSKLASLIRSIILREGDPIEEFELITLGEYETKQEAQDAEQIFVNMYCDDKGDRDSKLLLNQLTFKKRFRPVVTSITKRGLKGYEVRGGPNEVYKSFLNQKYSLEQLKEFAEEYAKTEVMPENYEQPKRGTKRKEGTDLLLPQFKIYLDEYKGWGSMTTIRNLMNISIPVYYNLLKMSGEFVS